MSADLVTFIRSICGHELECPAETDFFHLDYLDGESADDALVRLFNAEKKAQLDAGSYTSDKDVVRTLCHG